MATFYRQIEQTILHLLNVICDSVDITAIKLEYSDRFYWSGDWENFDSKKLLRDDRGMWCEVANRSKREWHSHSGWFDSISDRSKRLININVDAVSAARPGENQTSPSISILTLIQDQIIEAADDADAASQGSFTDAISQLDKQHVALKDILAEVIVPEMADRITLNPPSR
ncbi:hypothetical protein ACFZ8E_14795 [Methylobacterium sp. HMF5984]|uniref:hypothetical protein n=1 Tax=Methylobacterium sp. HMF5984 TaxID=3367370 RepID=UPI003852D147